MQGCSFKQPCEGTDLFEGSIIRATRRLNELMNQLKLAAKVSPSHISATHLEAACLQALALWALARQWPADGEKDHEALLMTGKIE